MQEENIEENETQNEVDAQPEEVPENKELNSILAQKQHWREKAEKLEQENEALKSQTKEEETEPADWKEVQERATKKAVEQVKKELSAKEEQQAREDAMLDAQFQSLKDLGHKITKEDETVILERMIKKEQDVLSAFKEYSQTKEYKERAKQRKEEGFVPSQSKGTVETGKGHTYQEIRSKSLDELIDEAS